MYILATIDFDGRYHEGTYDRESVAREDFSNCLDSGDYRYGVLYKARTPYERQFLRHFVWDNGFVFLRR